MTVKSITTDAVRAALRGHRSRAASPAAIQDIVVNVRSDTLPTVTRLVRARRKT